MSRIAPKKKYSWFMRLLFYFQKKKFGVPLEPVLLWGRTPKVFTGFLLMLSAFNRKKSPLTPVLRSLVAVRVSQLNEAAFCVDINSSLLLQRKGGEDSAPFTEKEKIALEYADEISKSSRVSDELFQRLKAHFDDDSIVELTALIGFHILSSKFNAALNAEAFGFCKTPPSSLP